MKKSNWYIFAFGAIAILTILGIGLYLSFFSDKTEPINMGSFTRTPNYLPTPPSLDEKTLEKITNGSSFYVSLSVQADPRADHKTVTKVITIPGSGINQNKAERRKLVNQKKLEYQELITWFSEPNLPFVNHVYLIVDTTDGFKDEYMRLTVRALRLFKIQEKIKENQSVHIQILKITGSDAFTERDTGLAVTFDPKTPWDETKLKAKLSQATNSVQTTSPIASTLGKVIRDLNTEGISNPTLIIISDGLENSSITNSYQNNWAFSNNNTEDSRNYNKRSEITQSFLAAAENPPNLENFQVIWVFPSVGEKHRTVQKEAKDFWKEIFTSNKAQFTLVD